MTDTQHSTLNTLCIWMGESSAWNASPSSPKIPQFKYKELSLEFYVWSAE